MVAADLAILASSAWYGTLFELQVDGSSVGVCTSLDEAIEWVSVGDSVAASNMPS